MKPCPEGWPRLSCSVHYVDAAKAIDWLCEAFGFETKLKIDGPNGTIIHSQLMFGEALVMIGNGRKDPHRKSPKELGGANTHGIMIFVDDVDAHCERARRAGAVIATEPKDTDYGEGYWADRMYEAVDPEGHTWWFTQRLSSSAT